jgi:hypothetical protein
MTTKVKIPAQFERGFLLGVSRQFFRTKFSAEAADDMMNTTN